MLLDLTSPALRVRRPNVNVGSMDTKVGNRVHGETQ